MFIFNIILVVLTVIGTVTCLTGTTLDRIVTHAHLQGGKLYPCPQNMCQVDPSTKLYFWIRSGDTAPNIFLQSPDSTRAIRITTNLVIDPTRIPMTRTLEMELSDEDLQMMEAEFPYKEMIETTYTFLITRNYRSWIALKMNCVRIKRFMEIIRRGQQLLCEVDE